MSHHRARRASTFWRAVLWVLLVLGLPLAWFAATHAPNEYQAMLGLDALDCDGPLTTYLFAAPVLLLYAVGFVVNALHWRKRTSLIAAGLCLGICVVVTLNVLDAVTEARRQGDACQGQDALGLVMPGRAASLLASIEREAALPVRQRGLLERVGPDGPMPEKASRSLVVASDASSIASRVSQACQRLDMVPASADYRVVEPDALCERKDGYGDSSVHLSLSCAELCTVHLQTRVLR